MLDKIPFLHGCEDEDEDDDSDEEDDFQGMATDCIDGPRKNKKSRVKVKRGDLSGARPPQLGELADVSSGALFGACR